MRKIVVYSTSTQTKTVLETEITTLGELKGILDEKGISYNGMTFYEGISNTELLDDNSILPSNLPYKGNVTNDLVIQLTLPNKKIESGLSRSEVYSQIKEYNLEGEVLKKYNTNYTRVSSEKLIDLIENAKKAKIKPIKKSFVSQKSTSFNGQDCINIIVTMFENTIKYNGDIREIYDISSLENILANSKKKEIESPFSDDEINALLK